MSFKGKLWKVLALMILICGIADKRRILPSHEIHNYPNREYGSAGNC